MKLQENFPNQSGISAKPRLLFFRRTRMSLPAFLSQHLDDQVKTLRKFFDVVLVESDCDYGQLCDRYEPDLAVFESGVYSGKHVISNTTRNPQVPKLGFLHADAYDSSRVSFLSDMDRWGVDKFFSTSAVMAEYTPEIADKLFVWPNSVDPEIYRDYGQAKTIPVLFTGSQARHYPWRNAVARIVSQHYPSMTVPHFGWNGGVGTDRMTYGESYARMLNSATFVPACGSMAHDLVRKHLEVPASMACLVTERTPTLEAVGFKDMVNCVFATESDVIEKLDYLASNPEALKDVTAAGHQLVHERHTQDSRSQILDWWCLFGQLKPGERIVQDSPDGALRVSRNGEEPLPLRSGGRDRVFLANGWRELSASRPDAAEREFLRCLNYFLIPEALLGLTFTSLSQGNPSGAIQWISQGLLSTLHHHGASDPDPVQWAVFIRSLLCAGDHEAAASAAACFPHLKHSELDRIRGMFSNMSVVPESAHQIAARVRPSVTPLPTMTDAEWLDTFLTQLRICGQFDLADRQVGTEPTTAPPSRHATRKAERKIESILRPRNPSLAEAQMRRVLRPVKRLLKSSPWSAFLQDLVRREDFTEALFFAVRGVSKAESAVKAGLRENPELPSVREDLNRRTFARPGSLVFVGTRDAVQLPVAEGISQAKLVIIEGTTDADVQRLITRLTEEFHFRLIADEPERRQGFAVLRNPTPAVRDVGHTTEESK